MFPQRHYVGSSQNTRANIESAQDPAASVSRHELRLVGHWPAEWVRSFSHGARHAVVLGECFESDEHVDLLLSDSPDLTTAAVRLGALDGSYSATLTEGPELVWVGDLAGLHRLWYRQSAETVRFASSPSALTGAEKPQPCVEGLTVLLHCPDLADLLGGSATHGASPVGPHQLLHVREGRASLRKRPLPSPGSALVEGATQLRSALSRTVARYARRSGTISADLSGGLDSSTLAVLAARYAPAPVRAVTYTDGFASNGEDLAYAQNIAEKTPNLRQEVIHGDARTLPFAAMEHVPATDAPSLDPLIWARTRARLEPARHSNAHLVGDGGDIVLGAPLTYLADLAANRDVRRFLSEGRALARLRHRPVHRVLRTGLATARRNFGATLMELARRLDQNHPFPAERKNEFESGIAWADLSDAVAWSTPWSRAFLADRLRETSKAHPPDHDGADAHTWRMIHRHTDATRTYIALAEQAGVYIRAPFFDNSVVTACSRVPAMERATTAEVKPLLRLAMSGLAPPDLYTRRTKGDYSACEYHGIRQNADSVRGLLRDSRLFELGIIRPGPVTRAVDMAVSGDAAPMAAINSVIAAELWLRAQDERQPAHERHSTSVRIGAPS